MKLSNLKFHEQFIFHIFFTRSFVQFLDENTAICGKCVGTNIKIVYMRLSSDIQTNV